MYIEKKLIGETVALKSVEMDDAEFILNIRNNEKISKFLPKLKISLEDQKKWINKQRSDRDSYYFIVEDIQNEKKLGTISVYDIVGNHGETGRFCSIGNFIQNTEAIVLLYDFVFYDLLLDYVTIWVYKENKPVIAMNTQIGFEWTEQVKADDGRDTCVGILRPERYENKIRAIRKSFTKMN